MQKLFISWRKSRSVLAGIGISGLIGMTYFVITWVGIPGTRESALAGTSVLMASTIRDITVYSSPTCGCCGAWVEHLASHGFQVKSIKTTAMQSVKTEYQVPRQLTSCHTGVIDGYVIEGHVPAGNIDRLLQQRPQIAGIAVPGMPIGSPGMEMGDRQDAFDVVAFKKSGETAVFQEYRF